MTFNPPHKSSERNLNLDIIRCTAVFSVLAVHFVYNTGFYSRIVEGKAMLLLVGLRTAMMICVPLFVLLTGYLCSRKELKPGYFRKLCPVLLSYLLCSILTLGYRRLVRREDLSLAQGILQILKISRGAVDYAWYVEMYIGLYLLIPFLNALYRGLKSKQEKQTLLFVLFVLTVLPNALNMHNLRSLDFWVNPRNYSEFHPVFPSWWTELWPVTYYFIGAYIREFDIKIPMKRNFLLLILSVCLCTGYNIYRSYGSYFFMPFDDNWGSIQSTANSTLLFLLLLHWKLPKLPKLAEGLIRRISKISFCIYLCSRISDWVVYGYFVQLPFTSTIFMILSPLALLTSFVLAALLGQAVMWTQDFLVLAVRKITRKTA